MSTRGASAATRSPRNGRSWTEPERATREALQVGGRHLVQTQRLEHRARETHGDADGRGLSGSGGDASASRRFDGPSASGASALR